MTHSDPISQFETTLETLRSLTDKMKGASGIHQIDIDLLQQKTRELYEQILTLEPVSFNPVEEEQTLPPQESATEPEPQNLVPLQQEEKIIQEENNEPEEEMVPEEDKQLEEETEPEEPVSEIAETQQPEDDEIQEEAYEDVVMEQISVESLREEPVTTQLKTTFDLFSESHDDSLGAALSQKANHTNLGERLEHSPVGDLREAIGINDKFQFINELFNGDLGQYNKVLDELNNFSSLQGALTYLSELSVQYDFQKSGMAFQRLKALLDKKYV